jgi:hypothetical protein
MSHEDGVIDIDVLASLGYRAIRCVRQNDYCQIRPDNLGKHRSGREFRSRFGPAAELMRRLGRRRFKVRGRRFPFESSGALPEDLPGPWISHEEVLMVWRELHDLDLELGPKGSASGLISMQALTIRSTFVNKHAYASSSTCR